MRLPYESWKTTLRKLGLRVRKKSRQVPAHRKSRSSQFEVLERREVMTTEIASLGLLNDTGTSNTDLVTEDPQITAMVSGEFAYATIEFDQDGDGWSEGEIGFTAPSVAETYDPSDFDSSLETYVGPVTIHYRWVEYDAPFGTALATGSWTAFDFTLEHFPEIEVLAENNVVVEDGVGSVSFGSTELGTPVSQTFTIKNLGAAALNLDTFSVPEGFSIDYLSSSVSPGDQTTMTIQLDATEDGVYFGQVSFNTNDPDESPYNFDISGQVTNLQPELELQLDSGADVSEQDSVDWGTTGVGTPLTRTFTIINSGTGPLILDPQSLILPFGFSLVSAFASEVAPYGGQTTFTVQLSAIEAGCSFGTLSFTSNDADESTFSITASGMINGEGWTGPDIAISGVALVNDTGHSSTDHATYDPRIAGMVDGEFNQGSVDVQFDHNDDGLIDGIVSVESAGGTFSYDPRATMPELSGYVGSLALRYRPVLRDSNEEIVSIDEWATFTLEMLPGPAAGNLRVNDFGLLADTGASSTDELTVDPRVYAVVAGDLEEGSARVEFDHDGDGTAEGFVIVTNNTDEFAYDPRTTDANFATPLGLKAISYRLEKRDAAGAVVATGGWDTFRFTLENAPASTWTISGLGLLVDNGAVSTDGITSDPTLKGTATGETSGSSALQLPQATIQLDLNGDSQPDQTVMSDHAGYFSYRPDFTSYGTKVVSARVKQWSPAYQQYLLAPWQEFSFQYVAESAPAVTNLHRVIDSSPAGLTSRIVTLAGTSGPQLRIEYDTTGDDTPEGSLYSDENGNFQFNPPGLAAGERTVKVRAARYDALSEQFVAGAWSSLTVTVEAFVLPTVTGMHLASDTGSSSTDGITTNPTLAGTLSGTSVHGMEVEFEHNGDETPDGGTQLNVDGSLQYRPLGLSLGQNTVRARTVAWDDVAGALAQSAWTSITFTLEAATFQSASFTALALAQDTGSSATDGVTTNATVSGTIAAHGPGNSAAFVAIEFDHNDDETIDGRTTTDADGKFLYVPAGLATGTHTLRARAKEWNFVTRQEEVSAWQPITLTLEAPQNAVPTVSLGLLADTGSSTSDGLTANGMLFGSVTNDQTNQGLVVEVDHDGDGIAEGIAYTGTAGTFSYDPQPLAYGTVNMQARAIEWNALTGQYQAGPWVPFGFTYQSQPSAPAQLTSVVLAEPIQAGSTTTLNPAITGTIVNAEALSGISLEVDTNADDAPDQTTTTDALGRFNLDLAVAAGAVSVQVRTREIEAGTGQLLYGAWTPFAFTYQQPTNAVPGLGSFTLKTDTGSSSTDGITTDSTLQGTVTNDGTVQGLTVVFDHNNDSVADGTATTDSQGNFTYAPSGLTFAAQAIRARVKELDADGVAQYGAWQTVSFTYEDASLVELRIDSLALTTDTGSSNTDGATADGTINGQVANNGGQAVTLEIDTNGDGTVDATVASATDGTFSYAPTGLANGLVTIRARIQAGTDQPAASWTSLSFVLHSDPDGTEAQALVSAFSGFNSVWQTARSDYQAAILNADLLFKSQTQTAQEAYDGTLSTAAAERKTQIDAAQAAYRAVLQAAESTRAGALGTAAGQFATDLASFAGDTTSYVLKPFVFPDAPPDFAHQIPDDGEQPQPPADKPLYDGTSYNFDADEAYQAAIAAADHAYNQTVRSAQNAYNTAHAAAEEVYRNAVAAAQAQYQGLIATANQNRKTALATGTNPIDIVAVTSDLRYQQQALKDEHYRENARAQQEYNEDAAAIVADYLAQVSAVELNYDSQLAALLDEGGHCYAHPAECYSLLLARGTEIANLNHDRDLELALLDEARALAAVGRLQAFENAHAALEKQLAEASANYNHWEKEREINADLVYEQAAAAAQKTLDIALAEARRVRSRSLATAAKDQEVAVQTAEVTRWKDKAEAQLPAVQAWATAVNTPWATYHKEQVEHAVAYVTSMAPKIIEQINADAQTALDEAHAVADRRKQLADEAAELKRQRRHDDAISWKDFRIVANNEVKNDAFSKALRWEQHNTAFRAAEAAFGTAQAHAQKLHDDTEAVIKKDEDVWFAEIAANTASDPYYLPPPTNYSFWDRRSVATHALTTSIITAKETRELAFSAAEKTHAANSNLDEREREDRLTDAYQAYQVAVAAHAKTFAVGYAAKYALYVKDVSGLDKTATKAFAASEKTLTDHDAALQKQWNDDDTQSLQDFYVAAANLHKTAIQAWDAVVDTVWSAFLVGLAGVELDRVNLLSEKLVSHALAAGSELVTWLTALSASAKGLADGTADGLDAQTASLAGALEGYAGQVAEARRLYAEELATKTAAHDKAISAQNQLYGDAQAERARVRKNAMDAAQWAYERAEADAWRDEVIVDGNYSNVWPRVEAVQISAGRTRRDAQATAERDHAVGLATDHKDWVHAVGGIHVTLAADAKAAADALAGSLKTASDGLTAGQAAAAKGLAADLATAEADYASGTATANANHGDAAAGPDGTLEIGLTEVANLLREGIVRERGEYEAESYAQHAAAIVATSSTSLIAPGGEGGLSGPLADLIAYQRAVAQHDLTWSQGAATARDNFEAALSDVYLNSASNRYGPGGLYPTWIHASGQASVGRVTAISAAVKTHTIESADNEADYAETGHGAATKAARDRTKARTLWDVKRAEAKRDYNNAREDAQTIRTTSEQDALLALTLAKPYPFPDPDTWSSSSEGQAAIATYNAAVAAAAATYNDAVASAKLAYVTSIADAGITQVTTLGTIVQTEATEVAVAGNAYVQAQNEDDEAFEEAVTDAVLPATQNAVASENTFQIAWAQNHQTAISQINDAGITFAQQMATLNAARVGPIAAAEGTYHLSVANRLAARHAAHAAGFPPNSPEAFAASQADAQAQWIDAMRGGYTAYSVALVQAQDSEEIAVLQAIKVADDSWLGAQVTHTSAVAALRGPAELARATAERDFAMSRIQSAGTAAQSRAVAIGELTGSYAEAQNTRAIADAAAQRTYDLALAQLENPLPPENEFKRALELAQADSSLAHIVATHGADALWTQQIVAGDKAEYDAAAPEQETYMVELSRIHRDLAIARAPHDEALGIAFAQASTTFMAALTAAQNSRYLAEANAVADWRSAEFAARSVALAGIDASIGLPWTDYQAAKVESEQAWWTNSGRANFLVMAGALISAESQYSTSVNAGLMAWANTTAQGERIYVQSEASQRHGRTVLNLAADRQHGQAIAAARQAWKDQRAENYRDAVVTHWTTWRDEVEAHGANSPSASALAAALVMEPSDPANDRARDAAEGGALFAQIVARTTSGRDYVMANLSSHQVFVTTVANADEALAIVSATAEADRAAAIAEAVSTHDVTETSTLADAIEALAAARSDPWSDYDAAVAAVDAAFTASAAPALRDKEIAVALAEKAFAITLAGASWVHANGREAAAQDQAVASANAQVQFATSRQSAYQNAVAGGLHAQVSHYDTSAPGAYPSGAPGQSPSPTPGGAPDVPGATPATPDGPAPADPTTINDFAKENWLSSWWSSGGGNYTLAQVIASYKLQYGEHDPLLAAFLTHGHRIGLGDVWSGNEYYVGWGALGDYIFAWVEEDLKDEHEAARKLRAALLVSLVYAKNWDTSFFNAASGALLDPDDTSPDDAKIHQKLQDLALSTAKGDLETLAESGKVVVSIFNEGADLAITLEELEDGNWWAALGLLPLVPGSIWAAAGKKVFRFVKGDEIVEVTIEVVQDIGARLKSADGGMTVIKRAIDYDIHPNEIQKLLDLRIARNEQEVLIWLEIAHRNKAKSVEELNSLSVEYMVATGAHGAAQALDAIDRYCFVPDTLIATAHGRKPIGAIETGEQVHAFDFLSGEWTLTDVLQRHDNTYVGPMVVIHIGECKIEATINHPFWIVEGEQLSKRSRPPQLAAAEDEGGLLPGRWVNSQHLQPGDLLVSQDGKSQRVTDVEITGPKTIAVCNLTVRGHHTFAVGDAAVLVHNMGWCDVLEKFAKREKPQDLLDYMKKHNIPERRLHGHHLVQRLLPSQWDEVKHLTEAQMLAKYAGENQKSYRAAWYIGNSHKILRDAGIDVLDDKAVAEAMAKKGNELYNLAWAVNGDRGIHSEAYVKAVWELLSNAKNKQGVIAALLKMREILEGGHIFW